MKVLITGGAGYIGSVLTPMLLDAGYQVTVLDNFIYGQNSLASLCRHRSFEVHKVDVRIPGAVDPYLADADAILPLAALVGQPICDLNPVDAELTNVQAPVSMFKKLSKDQLVVMPTTESAYGANADVCTEETPTNPISRYGKDKQRVEEALLQRENSISLRLATVFGMSPRMRLDLLVNDFTWKASKEGVILLFEPGFKRTNIHVRDVAQTFVFALENADLMAGEIYNAGTTSVSKWELCELISQYVPRFKFVEAGGGKDPDQRNYVVSSAKLKKMGWHRTVKLRDGVQELLKGYRVMKNTVYGNV